MKGSPRSPNCVSSQATDDRQRIRPLMIHGDADQAFARLKTILGKRSDTSIVAQNSDFIRVEFLALMGFVDDGEFLLDRQQRLIHIRSASRIGYWDLGKNRSGWRRSGAGSKLGVTGGAVTRLAR